MVTVIRPPIVRRWSASEDQHLVRLAEAGATLLRATAALNRRAPIVRKRARELGVELVGMREAKRRVRSLARLEANHGRSSSAT